MKPLRDLISQLRGWQDSTLDGAAKLVMAEAAMMLELSQKHDAKVEEIIRKKGIPRFTLSYEGGDSGSPAFSGGKEYLRPHPEGELVRFNDYKLLQYQSDRFREALRRIGESKTFCGVCCDIANDALDPTP